VKSLLLLLPLLLASLRPVRAGEGVALQPGESFTFRVGWGIFDHAGEVKVEATADTEAGRAQTRVITYTSTQGVIGMLYPFTGEVVAHFDAKDGLLTTARATTTAGKKVTRMSVDFDYEHHQAKYVDPLRPERDAMLAMPPGRPMDLITVLIQARAWDLKPGATHPALVLFDNEFYPLTNTARQVEKIDTATGRRDAMLLTPAMDGTPKGMFKKGGAIQVWISNDADRLPLKFTVKTKVGTATATLTSHQAPAAAVALTDPPR
jgi:hypothetical protein